MFVSAVVPAAGSGLRLGESIPKPLVELDKKPIFIHTLKALSKHPDIKEIILVVSPSALDSIKRYLKKYRIRKIKQLVIGGARRRDSVQNGLRCVSGEADMVLVHDAVRPFIKLNMISRLIKQAAKSGAAIPGVPIKSTLKEIVANKRVSRTLKRECVYEIQTPQVFKRNLLIKAYRKFPSVCAVDDSSLIERLGNRVVVVLGSYFNIKITTPEDLIFARALLKTKGHPFSRSRDEYKGVPKLR